MIDMMTEQLIPLRDVTKLLPASPRGKRIHISSVYRWTLRGLGGHRLEVIKIGGTTYTTREALQRWAELLTSPMRQILSRPLPERIANQETMDRVARKLGLK